MSAAEVEEQMARIKGLRARVPQIGHSQGTFRIFNPITWKAETETILLHTSRTLKTSHIKDVRTMQRVTWEQEREAPVLQLVSKQAGHALNVGLKRAFWVKSDFVDVLQ